MHADREKVAELSDRIRRNEYRVEPVVVADAILRQLRALSAARAEHVCSGERACAADVVLRLNARSRPGGFGSH
jgi:hypothetical protein